MIRILALFLSALLGFGMPAVEAQTESKAKTKKKAGVGKAGGASSTGEAKPKADAEPVPSASPQEPAATPDPSASAAPAPTPRRPEGAFPNATLEPEELAEFDAQPERVQKLIRAALALTKRDLTYLYGSADPAQGGMDCSGTIYYLLKSEGIKDPPRSSSDQYVWLRKQGLFRAVLSNKEDTFELDELQPGDLLFWTGTYTVERDPPVTHAMIYLGKVKKTGRRAMVGASDGRSYEGKKRWGVSVFDFRVAAKPKADGDPGTASRFVGYAPLPEAENAAAPD